MSEVYKETHCNTRLKFRRFEVKNFRDSEKSVLTNNSSTSIVHASNGNFLQNPNPLVFFKCFPTTMVWTRVWLRFSFFRSILVVPTVVRAQGDSRLCGRPRREEKKAAGRSGSSRGPGEDRKREQVRKSGLTMFSATHEHISHRDDLVATPKH